MWIYFHNCSSRKFWKTYRQQKNSKEANGLEATIKTFVFIFSYFKVRKWPFIIYELTLYTNYPVQNLQLIFFSVWKVTLCKLNQKKKIYRYWKGVRVLRVTNLGTHCYSKKKKKQKRKFENLEKKNLFLCSAKVTQLFFFFSYFTDKNMFSTKEQTFIT